MMIWTKLQKQRWWKGVRFWHLLKVEPVWQLGCIKDGNLMESLSFLKTTLVIDSFFFLRYLEDCRRSMFESELGFVLDKFCILNITTKIIIFNKCYFYFIWKASRKRENVGQKNITSFSLLSQVHTTAVVETVWSQELGIQPRSFTWMGVSKILE